jgi:hypothetical protein
MELQKTLYTFIDIHGESSTLTLDKHVSDSLQKQVGDVHQWIQKAYNFYISKYTNRSRRATGDAIRRKAYQMLEVAEDF